MGTWDAMDRTDQDPASIRWQVKDEIYPLFGSTVLPLPGVLMTGQQWDTLMSVEMQVVT